MKNEAAPEDVKLGLDQSADPGKCGSCQFFRHRQPDYDTMGVCRLKLPPWTSKMWDDNTMVWEVDPRTVRDTDDCSFYVAKNVDGVKVCFVQTRVWRAGEKSK